MTDVSLHVNMLTHSSKVTAEQVATQIVCMQSDVNWGWQAAHLYELSVSFWKPRVQKDWRWVKPQGWELPLKNLSLTHERADAGVLVKRKKKKKEEGMCSTELLKHTDSSPEEGCAIGFTADCRQRTPSCWKRGKKNVNLSTCVVKSTAAVRESSRKVDVFTHFLLTTMSVEALETFPNPHNGSGVSQGKPPPKANTTEVTSNSEKTNIKWLRTFSTLLALCHPGVGKTKQSCGTWNFLFFLPEISTEPFSEEQK